jgi:hypothetical protein
VRILVHSDRSLSSHTDWITDVKRNQNEEINIKANTALGPTQPPIQWVPGALSPWVKRPKREAGHSPPSSAEVKECMELYLHSSNTPSWRGAYLSTGTTLPLLYLYLTPQIMWRLNSTPLGQEIFEETHNKSFIFHCRSCPKSVFWKLYYWNDEN